MLRDSAVHPTSTPALAAEVFVSPRARLARPRVAVVDDSREFLDLLRDVLGERYDVTTYQVLHSIAELSASAPDLLVVDLHCGGPEGGLTGWEILARARGDDALRQVPAVVCSADLSALRQDRMRLVAHGDVQLVAKPFDVQAFERVVERMLRLAGVRRLPIEEADYPPLRDVTDMFREGRPLKMCPHGRVLDQGDHCSRCA